MIDNTQNKKFSNIGSDTLEFDDSELRNTMHKFLNEESKKTDQVKSIWNFATLSGLSMLTAGMIFSLSWLGLPLGNVSVFFQNIIPILPFLGAFLVLLVGFGYFVGDRKKVKSTHSKKAQHNKATTLNQDNKKNNNRTSGKYMDDIHGGDFSYEETFNTLNNDLEDEKSDSNFSNKAFGKSDTFTSTNFGYKKIKKLMKSRSDKKISGVCGGLANYFGISSTVLRLLFVLGFFATSGTSFFIYIGLSLAMPKEPMITMEDFE